MREKRREWYVRTGKPAYLPFLSLYPRGNKISKQLIIPNIITTHHILILRTQLSLVTYHILCKTFHRGPYNPNTIDNGMIL